MAKQLSATNPTNKGWEVAERDLPAVLHRFVRIVGWNIWSKRLERLEKEMRTDSAMRHFWAERCALELAFASVWQRFRTMGRLPRIDSMTPDAQRFLGFATGAVRCYDRLSQLGRKRLKGMLLDATKKDHGLAPLAHEMFIAAHLSGRGYDVKFHDLESGSGFDLMASKAGRKVQIECKHISGDIGRQIHRKDFYRFGDQVVPQMLRHLGNLETGLFLRLQMPGRLHRSQETHEKLAGLLGRAMVSGLSRVEEMGACVEVREFDVGQVADGWALARGVDKLRIEGALATHFGLVNKNVFVCVKPRQSAIVVVVESMKEDRVLAAIHRTLRNSAKDQFDDGSPAILCCHLAEVTEEQLASLSNKGERGIGLDHMTSNLLERRPNLHSVTYMGQGRVRERLAEPRDQPQRSIGETGPVYTIKNPNHPMAGEDQLSIFAEGWP